MNKPPHNDAIREAKLAAYFLASRRSHKEIQDLLHITPSTLSRRLETAREHGWLDETPRCSLDNEDVKSALKFKMAQDLHEKILRRSPSHRHLKRITIVETAATPEVTRANIGITAADIIRRNAAANVLRLVGISWGATLREVVNACATLASGERQSEQAPIQFFPLAGDLIAHPEQRELFPLLASTLVLNLTDIFGGSRATLNFLPAPAYMPATFLDESGQADIELNRIRTFVQSMPRYRAFFGPSTGDEKCLVESMDGVITGVGQTPSTQETVKQSLTYHIRMEELEALEKVAIGDICGHLIPTDTAGAQEKRLIENINLRVFTPDPGVFYSCAERAKDSDILGSFIVAHGVEKARIIRHACVHGLATEVVIDEALARRMDLDLDIVS